MDYEKNAQAVLKAIAAAGKDYTITRKVSTFDNITGKATDAPDTMGKLTAIILPRYKGPTFDSLDDALKEALIKGKAKTVLAAAAGTTLIPEALDEITIEGKAWRVIGCTEVNPAGTPILYTIGITL